MHTVKESSIGYWVHRVGMALRTHLDAGTREDGMAAAAALILDILDQLGPSSLSDISRTLGHAHPSVLRQIDNLEDAGYVERVPHPDDRRMKLVCLTGKGKQQVPIIKRHITGTHEAATRGFDESSVDELLTILRRIAVNLECDEAVDACGSLHDTTERGSDTEERTIYAKQTVPFEYLLDSLAGHFCRRMRRMAASPTA